MEEEEKSWRAEQQTYNPLSRNLNSLNSMERAALHLSFFHSISQREKELNFSRNALL